MRKIVVGTRQSALALTQTNQVIDELSQISRQKGIECEFEIRKIVTKGDRILDVTLSKVGGKGLFVKEIEQALIDGDIDMAVHSMKDMPWELQPGLINGAFPKRVDARDALISRGNIPLAELRAGAKIGTSSLRRASQLKRFRPDFQLEPIRGNIDSRLRKLETEGFDAVILAAAGLKRIGWEDRISQYIQEDICLPAVGQGALGIECRQDDTFVRELLAAYSDPDTELAVRAERSFLGRLNGGCQIPMGAYAILQKPSEAEAASSSEYAGRVIDIQGMVGSPDGSTVLRGQLRGTDPDALGIELAESLLEAGADKILAELLET